MKSLVLGSGGLLGSSLVPMLRSGGHDLVTHSRDGGDYQTDLTNRICVTELLDAIRPELIINLAGLTDVDRCEIQPHQAYLANVRIVEIIADWIKKNAGCHLIHISTDQVYDGEGPHTEEQVTLRNYYAFSKYAGELVAARVSSTVVRTNFFGRSHCPKRASFSDWLFRSLSNGDTIQVFENIQFNPLSMFSLSQMIELIMREKPVGIFNVGSHGGTSKANFAFAFAEELKLRTTDMTRTSTDKVGFLKSYRPKDMRTDCSKFENALGVQLPTLKNEINRVAKEYYEKR